MQSVSRCGPQLLKRFAAHDSSVKYLYMRESDALKSGHGNNLSPKYSTLLG